MENKTFYISKRFVSLFKQNAMIVFIIFIVFGVLFPSWILESPPMSDITLLFVLIFCLPAFIFYTITCYTIVLIFSRLLKQSYVKIFPDHVERFDCKILLWELKTNWYFEKIKEIKILKTKSGDICSITLITGGGISELLNYGICDYDDMKDILSSIIDAVGDKVKIKTNITFFHPSQDLIGRLILFFCLSVNWAILFTMVFLTSEPFMPDGTPFLNRIYSLWNSSRYICFLLIGINLLFISDIPFSRIFSLEKDVIHLEIKNLIWGLLLLISGGILLYMSMIY